MNIVFAFIATIIITFIFLFISARRKRKNYQNSVESFAKGIFQGQSYVPEVTANFAYGIPCFTLKFDTDKDKEHAISKELTAQFIDKVQDLCGHLRPRGELFDAKRAVSVFSKEDQVRWAEVSDGNS